MQPERDFGHCLSPYCFIDQIVTSCMGILSKGPWFTFAHTENGGGASFALLNKKLVCFYFLHRYSLLRTLLSLSRKPYRINAAWFPRTRAALFTVCSSTSGDLIYIPHLLAHAILTLNTGSPTIFSGWDAATTNNQQFFFKLWMSILSVCLVVNGAKFSVKKVYQHYVNGCFLLQQALRKVRKG